MCRVQEDRKRTNRWHRSGCCAAAAVLWLVAGLQASAQWSLTQFNVPVTEDFSSFTAPDTWATANPAAGQLDSDIWGFSQTTASGSASSVFGLNYIFGEGVNTGGATTFGVYAFDTGTGVKGIGPQADDGYWSPGNLTVKLQNDTGSVIDKLRIEWSYLLYNDQTGRRSSQLLVSATDIAGSYIAPFGGEVLTQSAPQASPSWGIIPRDVTWNVSIPDGDDYYLRWSFGDLLGDEGMGVNRDEVGIANLRVTPVVPIMGDYNNNGEVDAADYSAWRDALTAGATSLTNDPTPGVVDETDFDYWRAHFGETLGSGAGAAQAAAIPEPSTLALFLVGSIAIAGRWRANFLVICGSTGYNPIRPPC